MHRNLRQHFKTLHTPFTILYLYRPFLRQLKSFSERWIFSSTSWFIARFTAIKMTSDLPAPDDYFNDLSRQPNMEPSDDESPPLDRSESALNGEEHGQPRVKRIACVVCRKRKLKCNGEKPSCGTCSRLGHTCAYDEIRRKSGPKRGYVKELEARLGLCNS